MEEGSPVLIIFKNGKRSLHILSKKGIHTHKGYIDYEKIVSLGYGSKVVTNLGEEVVVAKPTLSEIIPKIARKTQIVYPKEVGYAILKLGIGNGSRVLEVGTGSGATTAVLASFVRPNGKVVSFDINEEFLKLASKNIEKLSLKDFVEFRLHDIRNGIEEREFFDAAFVDIPDPWTILKPLSQALKPSSRVAIVVPTFNQLEKLSENITEDFIFDEAVDITLYEIQLKKGAIRPTSLARAHNAFLVFLIKVKAKQTK